MKSFMANYSPALAWYLVVGSSLFAAAWLFALGVATATFVVNGFRPAPMLWGDTTLVISSLPGIPMLWALFLFIPATLFEGRAFGR